MGTDTGQPGAGSHCPVRLWLKGGGGPLSASVQHEPSMRVVAEGSSPGLAIDSCTASGQRCSNQGCRADMSSDPPCFLCMSAATEAEMPLFISPTVSDTWAHSLNTCRPCTVSWLVACIAGSAAGCARLRRRLPGALGVGVLVLELDAVAAPVRLVPARQRRTLRHASQQGHAVPARRGQGALDAGVQLVARADRVGQALLGPVAGGVHLVGRQLLLGGPPHGHLPGLLLVVLRRAARACTSHGQPQGGGAGMLGGGGRRARAGSVRAGPHVSP